MSSTRSYDFGALVPGVGVFGGVRRFIEVGNELTRRGHRYTLYHSTGEPPDWIPYAGETRPLDALAGASHDVLITNDPTLFGRFRDTPAPLKLFYFAGKRIANERNIVRSDWTIVANSENMHRYLRRRYRIDADRAVGGINLETFRPRDVSRDDDVFRIATFGRTSRRSKGVPIVLRAVERFARQFEKRGGTMRARSAQLVLFDHVGAGHEADPSKNFRCDVSSEWHLNLSQPDLARLYASCDLFINAEKRGGWANTVIEAMACGVPVVCTRSGTLDVAFHDRTAWVARFRHPWFLKRGMDAIAYDPQRAARLRNRALERVQRFSWPSVVDQLLEVIDRRFTPC